MSTGLRRFDLRLDTAERAALRRIADARGVPATVWLRQLIRAAAGLPSLLADHELIGDVFTDDSSRSNGHGDLDGHDEHDG